MTERPTTRDLARAAGVSLATVDRVLNGRAGVRAATAESVRRAIQEIGFERNTLAAALARRRPMRFAFVLPAPAGEFVDQILGHLETSRDALAAERIETETFVIAEGDPHTVAGVLSGLDPDRYDGAAIMAPETPQVRDAMRRMAARGVEPIAFIAGQVALPEMPFVGIDNRAAGATAGELMGRLIAPRAGSILVVGENLRSRDSLDRRLGFDAVMGEMFPELVVLPSIETRGEAERTRAAMARAMASHDDLVGIYILAAEARLPIMAIAEARTHRSLVRIAHERTASTEAALRSGALDALITQDQGHLVRSAIRTLRARCEGRATLAAQERIRIEILIRHNL